VDDDSLSETSLIDMDESENDDRDLEENSRQD